MNDDLTRELPGQSYGDDYDSNESRNERSDNDYFYWRIYARSEELEDHWVPRCYTEIDLALGLVIGRSLQDANLAIADSSVSRRHARIVSRYQRRRMSCNEPVLMIEDLDSANGTLEEHGFSRETHGPEQVVPIQGDRPVQIECGHDHGIRIGDVHLTFEQGRYDQRSFFNGGGFRIRTEFGPVDIPPFVSASDYHRCLLNQLDLPQGHHVERPWGQLFLAEDYDFFPEPRLWHEGTEVRWQTRGPRTD